MANDFFKVSAYWNEYYDTSPLGVYNAHFQFFSFSKVCYSFLRTSSVCVNGSANGNIYDDYITRRNKTKRN